jgi:hypothetical protein
MVNIANIVCKTAGIAGLSAVIYDGYAMAKHHSDAAATEVSADIFEKAVAAERSNSSASHLTNAMQKGVADFRMKNPIVPIFGKIKGFIEGFFTSLGDNIIPTGLSAIAIGTKGKIQKAGGWGLLIYGIYQLAKEGFGLGKTSPMDK